MLAVIIMAVSDPSSAWAFSSCGLLAGAVFSRPGPSGDVVLVSYVDVLH